MRRWQYISNSIQGTERKENKDRIFVIEDSEKIIAFLFDGISSAEEANKGIDLAIDFIKENYKKIDLISYNISDLIFDINQKIISSKLDSPFSTYGAVYIPKTGEMAFFSNLGDSRIYEITPQYLKQLSQDDNLIHNKNVVTRYLGMVQLDKSQIRTFSANVNSKRFLLCSDGFYLFVEENLPEFYKIFNFKKPLNIKKALERKIKGKNFDDASYILIFQ